MIVYGDSLVLEGVRAGLETCADIKVIPLNPPSISLAKEIMAQGPVALIFDSTAGQSDFPGFLFQQPDLLLIGIDPETHQALVWSGRQSAVIEAADLLSVIRRKGSPTYRKWQRMKVDREQPLRPGHHYVARPFWFRGSKPGRRR